MTIATLQKLFNIDLNIKNECIQEINITKVNNNNIALEHLFSLDFTTGQAKHIRTIDAITKKEVGLC